MQEGGRPGGRAKSTPEQIRERFDRSVERFSNLETGQSATMDAPLVLDLVSRVAAATNPAARRVLDVGCGAGNYSIKLLDRLPGLRFDLIDLSAAMLTRAAQRIEEAGGVVERAIQVDIRSATLPDNEYDIVIAAAVLHHIRTDDEWRAVFAALHATLKPGGSLWITDLIDHSSAAVGSVMWDRYGEYLVGLGGDDHRRQVFEYIEMEDSPRPILFQLDLLREVGFRNVEILHKNAMFAAFGGSK